MVLKHSGTYAYLLRRPFFQRLRDEFWSELERVGNSTKHEFHCDGRMSKLYFNRGTRGPC